MLVPKKTKNTERGFGLEIEAEYMSFKNSKNQTADGFLNHYENETPVADLVYSFDWASTPLGAMDTWSTSLRANVDLIMHAVFPMAIYYGPEHTLIYNQMWRPIIKMKHPALGKTVNEVWPEITDIVNEIFNNVYATKKGRFHEDLLYYLNRDGYLEETYFSFTFSPIFKEDGSIGGVFNCVQETTKRVVMTRQIKALGELGHQTPGAKSMEDACHLVTSTLREHNDDIPYALIYLIEDNNTEQYQRHFARLVATTFDENLNRQIHENGVEEMKFVNGHSSRKLPDFLPNTQNLVDITATINKSKSIFKKSSNICSNSDINGEISFSLPSHHMDSNINNDNTISTSQNQSWPIHQVIQTKSHVIVTLADGSQAILLPVSTTIGGKSVLTAVLICGLNKHRKLNDTYMEFLQLVVGHVGTGLTHGQSREEERRQTELLADLNRQKIMFFQNISHELRTPLTLMLAPLDDAIAACSEPSPILQDLEMIRRNARRLLKLVNTLLQFSQIEAGRLEACFCETNIAKHTLELVSSFESLAKSFKLNFTINIPNPQEFEKQLKKKTFLDVDLYEKIVFNLCSNAFKYTWHGGVTVRLYREIRESKEVVVFEVEDTGVGISPEHLPNLFQRFYRIESHQARSHEGTGIGLALVKELANRHGGDIEVESHVDVGSKFRVWIPTGYEHLPRKNICLETKDGVCLNRVEQMYTNGDLYLEEGKQWIQERPVQQHNSPLDEQTTIESLRSLNIASPLLEGRLAATSSETRASPPVLSDEKCVADSDKLAFVLVVDDNSDMRNYLSNVLKTEFEVRCATDGRDALRIMQDEPRRPDLVLSDIMMPNMDGFALLTFLRSNPVTQLIPVILLSARAGEEASIEGLGKGADDYLIKPFNARELIARVRVNIELSRLRHELIIQQRRQTETKQILFSISSKIRSGLNIQGILSTAVMEIHRILACDSLLVLCCDPMNKGVAKIMAASSSSRDIQLLIGTQVPCRAIDDTQDAWVDQLDVLPPLDTTNKFSFPLSHNDSNSITTSIGTTVPRRLAFLDTIDNDIEYLDLEIECRTNDFSQVVNKTVSSMSVAIRLNSSFWGWIIAYRKPNEKWTDSEQMFMQQISNQISLAITHSKLMEEKMKREAQMEAAKAANEAKSQILANTSHELRTPLGAIIGVLSAFEDSPLTPDQKDMVNIMTRASDVVLSVVNDILDAAKLEAQKITLMNRTFDLFDLVEKTIEIFGERAGTKQIELVLLFEPTELPKYVKSDPERLQQVLMNLLSNSVKFTESGEIVLKISLASSDTHQVTEDGETGTWKTGTLLIELTDTGIGIDPAFMKDIWESFSQGDPSMTRRQDGTGLGLSICKHLVTINGGDLGVQSELGKGSRFWFTWNIEPLSLAAAPLTSPPQLNSSDVGTSAQQAAFVVPAHVHSKRVFVVDSVETARSAITTMLNASVEQVTTFDDCEQALTAAKSILNQFNRIPCDVIFFNVTKENSEKVEKTAKEFQELCGGKDNISIGLMIFWSGVGRALGKEMIHRIGGHVAALCKPIMQRRLLDCLQNTEIFRSSESSEPKTATFAINRFRIEDYYHHNRPNSERNHREPSIIRKSSLGEDEIMVTTSTTTKGNDIEEYIAANNKNILNNKTICEKSSRTVSTGDITNDNSRLRPLNKRSASSEYDEERESNTKSRTRIVSPTKCVLCVEDNPINMRVLQHQLSKLGYQTLSATNGLEAVNLVKAELEASQQDGTTHKTRVSLILMDCAMPVMSGFDASREIRSMGITSSEIPIIALTAYAVEGTREKCLDSGMSDYLTKPLKVPELREKLIQWLGNDFSSTN
ncbi:7235_t:CDS:10 [Ambispora leptoticha]|uniref:histidine kinase n=1 Tax=Ambispora leptoticha TaxID=144679 RepID=A0A9N8Z8B2_9GLOM|nr:7235_t:CDS:10 [Ambispora leptoticha]